MTISGGEPGLRPDLPELIAQIGTWRLQLTVFTNGLAATERVLEHLSRAGARMAVSIDGANAKVHEALRGRGNYARAVGALERAVGVLGGTGVMLSSLLSRPLLAEVAELWEFGLARGVGALYLGLFEPIGPKRRHALAPEAEELMTPVLWLLDAARTTPDMTLLFSESYDLIHPQTVFCRRREEHMLGRTVKVQADGWALPGPFFYAPRFYLGRPTEEGWSAVANSQVRADLRRQTRRRAARVAACRTCFWRERCRGGSLALTWATFGTWSVPCPLCRLYQATLDHAARRHLTHGPSPLA